MAKTDAPSSCYMEDDEAIRRMKSRSAEQEANALQQHCSDRSLAEIAKELVNCDQLWPYLGISEAAHEEIYRDHYRPYGNYKHQLLLAWRRRHGVHATYQKLCVIFEECGNRDIIEVVKHQASYEYEPDSDTTSTTSGYSASLDSFEAFETDPTSLSFIDLLDDIMDAIKIYCKDKIKILKIKINAMLNSESPSHNVPRRHIEKLSKHYCETTDEIFNYFSNYIKRESPAVLRIIVDASGCSKAKHLYEDYFE